MPKKLNINTLSKGTFKDMVNLTTRTINFDNGTNLRPFGVLASVSWKDEERPTGGILLLKRHSEIKQDHIAQLDTILGEDTLGIVSMHFVKEARGTILEGRVASNIHTTNASKISHSSKFAI